MKHRDEIELCPDDDAPGCNFVTQSQVSDNGAAEEEAAANYVVSAGVNHRDEIELAGATCKDCNFVAQSKASDNDAAQEEAANAESSHQPRLPHAASIARRGSRPPRSLNLEKIARAKVNTLKFRCLVCGSPGCDGLCNMNYCCHQCGSINHLTRGCQAKPLQKFGHFKQVCSFCWCFFFVVGNHKPGACKIQNRLRRLFIEENTNRLKNNPNDDGSSFGEYLRKVYSTRSSLHNEVIKLAEKHEAGPAL